MLILIAKPFSLLKFSSLLALRIVLITTITWLHMMKSAVSSIEHSCRRILLWLCAVVFLPFQDLTAVRREKMLQGHVQEMQFQVESLVWEKDELQQRLQKALMDRKMMEIILTEAEEGYKKAVAKTDLLEIELQSLKDESARLLALRGKHQSDLGAKEIERHRGKYEESDVEEYGARTWNSGENVALHDIRMHDDPETIADRPKSGLVPGSKTKSLYPLSTQGKTRNTLVEEARDYKRSTAISRSLFSTMLSLVVGMIIWEAKNPCLPLVVALFSVVGISLKDVIQFFSTIEVKPASDAVALLSFNCFILGTITFPTLPAIARIVFPSFERAGLEVFSWFSSYFAM